MRVLVLLAVPLWAAEDVARQAAGVIERNCAVCHGAAMQMSKLDLRTRESMLKGGEHGAALSPGNPEKSRLYRFASGLEQPSMPPGKKLPGDQLDILRRWIEAGAPALPAVESARPGLSALEERPITSEERNYWAFRAPARRPVPTGAPHPIDAFLGKTPSPAGGRTLVRRVYLDLIGLPPSPSEVEAFLADSSPDAYEKLVDRLLASPHYGERWGRHWLDLVRYADSAGYEFDRDRPNAWRYRDYVIRAFNNDKPYDQFIREQIAGDENAPESHDALIATGFLRHGPEANIKTEQTRMDELDDILATTSTVFLGMTVGCARCHNHKFDPIPQKDYYRMQAVFFPSRHADIPLATAADLERRKAANQAIEEQEAPLKKQRTALEKPYRDRLLEEKKANLPDYIQLALRTPPEQRTEGQRLSARQVDRTLKVTDKEVLAAMPPADLRARAEIEEKLEALEQRRPAPLATALGVSEGGAQPPPSYFLHHGSPGNKGSPMNPGVLTVAAKGEMDFPAPPDGARTSHRRKVFAQWIASPDNPLTARVMVNRIWQHHFGEGIVATPSNFGRSGQRPTQPELLDWLAAEFVARSWSIKSMHRLMLTSAAYRSASLPLRRLEGEIIRDSILTMAGTLDLKMGGPGVFPYIDPALWQSSSGRTWPGRPDNDAATWRRSLYIFTKRTIPYPMLDVFDKPDTIGSCARRNQSTIAPQALILMNNTFVEMQARYFAQRLQREAGGDPGAQVDRAFALALARPPSAGERAAAVEFVRKSPYGLVDFCQAVFNMNEVVYAP